MKIAFLCFSSLVWPSGSNFYIHSREGFVYELVDLFLAACRSGIYSTVRLKIKLPSDGSRRVGCYLLTMCLQSIVRYRFPSLYWDFNLNK
jgi:hypothetical protein